ncbi:MAG TPA: class I SAM-dependent methyltransferase [Gemmatimonadaceae bacterium]
MNTSDAIEMIRDAVGVSAGVWADLGAGTGTFTRALTKLLGAGSIIYAVDDDARAERALRELSSSSSGNVQVTAVNADFTRPLELPGLVRAEAQLDGILLANALHFVRDAENVLSRLVKQLRPGGRMIVVEYDGRAASRWVPYPIPASRWLRLAESAGLTEPTITATRPSSYSGILYTAVAMRPIVSE